MDEADATWAPQSPDLSAYHSSDRSHDYVHPQHQGYRPSISHTSPYSPPSSSPTVHNPFTMPRAVKREDTRQDPDYLPEPSETAIGKRPDANNGAAGLASSTLASGAPKEIVIKNHFPVARIKRIMQADDDVGKVAQVTPVVVSKALELFMISLVTKAAAEARSRNSKRVAPLHLKQVVTTNEQFDFLSEIVAKVADAPAPSDKSADAMDMDGKKRKGPGKRRKKADDDDF